MLRKLWTLLDRGIEFTISFRFWGVRPLNKPTFFTLNEVTGLDQELIAKLDWARGRAGIPFVITNGVRTPSQNAKVGGVEDSSHLKGLAVDLRCSDGETRFKIVNALLLAGFKRIGVYDKHCHVDISHDLPQNVMWTGISH